MPLLSIIVPVYKVEETLDRCLKSIVGQSWQDWEAILVDDGSPDACPARCDEWAARDDRFRVIHKRNGGLSDARNKGLEVARGDYVTFVDSDDYLAPDTYGPLMAQLQAHADYDLLEYPVSKRFPRSGNSREFSFGQQEWTDAKAYWLEGCAYEHAFAWNKIYRRALFNTVTFPKGRVFEDIHTLPHLLKQAHVIATTDAGRYFYMENPHGITMTAGAAELETLLAGHLKAMDALQLLSPLTPAATRYYMHVLNIQLSAHALSHAEPRLPSLRVKFWQPGMSLSARIKALLLNLLGIRKLCILYRTLLPRGKSR